MNMILLYMLPPTLTLFAFLTKKHVEIEEWNEAIKKHIEYLKVKQMLFILRHHSFQPVAFIGIFLEICLYVFRSITNFILYIEIELNCCDVWYA